MFKIRGVTRNVVVMGIVSFLTDVASEMLYPIMPLFLTGVLGASPALLGLIDGLAEGISSGLRWIAGALSDRFQRRKPFVVGGYTLSALTRPLMGLAAFAIGWPLFLVARCADRLGKSIRTSARDALIADSTQPEFRGVAFGFHRAADTCGAVVGPLLALAILLAWPKLPLAWLFFIAFIPGLLSALLALLAINDIPRQRGTTRSPAIFQRFPSSFWVLLVANGLFSLGNSSDSFMVLRSKELGLSFPAIILAFASYNTVYAIGALPLGALSDRVGRKPIIIAGWMLYALVYLGFAMLGRSWAPWLLFPLYGLYQAFSEGVSKAMVSDLVPASQRAGAIGLFYTVSGIGQLLGSILAGVVWNIRFFDGRVMAAFAIGCAFACAGALSLLFVRQSPGGTHFTP
jgi:MFS family permease